MATVYTFTPRSTVGRRRGARGLGFFQNLGLAIIAMLAVLLLTGGWLLVREWRSVRSLSLEVGRLEREVGGLRQEYERLTARDVVLARARDLGLHPARPEQVVRLP